MLMLSNPILMSQGKSEFVVPQDDKPRSPIAATEDEMRRTGYAKISQRF
jgi:hypothetical protein